MDYHKFQTKYFKDIFKKYWNNPFGQIFKIGGGVMIFLFIASSCRYFKKESSDNVIARAYDKYLYQDDLTGLLPPNTNPQDSVVIVKNYINKWIEQQVLLNKAEENLSEEQQNFEDLIQEYKNSLIIYHYEKELIEQNLDTVVTEEQIQEYYKQHSNEFVLKENILRANYIKIPDDAEGLQKVKQLFRLKTKANEDELFKLAENYAVTFHFDDSAWIFFNDLLKEIPIKTYNQEQYLQNHRIIEMNDSAYVYLLNIHDFKIKESTSPLNLESKNIKNILLNKRKIEFIHKMHKDLYEEALSKKSFEVY